MNAKQEAKLNMYRATQQNCIDNDPILRSVPAFANMLTAFNTKVSAIIAAAQQEDLVTKGITIGKSDAKKNLCRLAADIGAAIYAFAVANSNNQLKQEVNFSFSDLFKTKDEILAPRVQNIKDLGTGNLPALLEYGLTAASLEALQVAIDEYRQKVPAPRNAAAQKIAIRQNLKNLFAETDAVLKDQMDKAIISFRNMQPGFVAAYKANRVIVDPGNSATSLKGTVTSAPDAAPIANATITIEGASFKATTGAKGSFEIKPAPVGTFPVHISAAGYTGQKLEVKLKLGQAINLSVSLNPL